MKKTTKLLLLLIALLTSVMVVGCDWTKPTVPSVTVVGEITLDKTTATMKVGEKLTLTATTKDLTGEVMWSSSDNAKATVDNGVVTALAEGEVTIKAAVGDIEATCVVTISAAPVIGSITLNKTTAVMDLYEVLMLEATLENLTGNIVWTSSDPTIATVSNGVVTSLAEGDVTITATVGEYSATCMLAITSSGAYPVLSVDKGNEVVTLGESLTVTPKLEYKGEIVDASYEYVSSNSSVATITNGEITTVGYGSATITVTASWLGFEDSKTFTITVTSDVSFKLSENELTLSTIAIDDYLISKEITAIVVENNIELANPSIEWLSNNEDVVTVENGVITAVGVGKTIVVATLTAGNNEQFVIELPVSVVKPSLDVDYTVEVEILADDSDYVFFDISSLGNVDNLVKTFDGTIADDYMQLPYRIVNDYLVLAKEDLYHGERKLVLEYNDIIKVIDFNVITKYISTAEELLNLRSYSPNVKSYTWSKWSDETTFDNYDGYFVLTNHIDLKDTVINVIKHNGTSPARVWDSGFGSAGFNGTFNGRGYSIVNGVYSQGGLFGYLSQDGVIKNVAFVNARIDNVKSSCIIGLSVWGTLDNVLIQVVENNVPDGEIGLVAMNTGKTFKSNNVIVYDDSAITTDTAGNRSSFVNHAADAWGTYTNTYVFTNSYVAQAKNEAACPVDPIAPSKTLAEAGVNVSAFSDIWDMSGYRARFANSSVIYKVLDGVKSEFDMGSDKSFELNIEELLGKNVTNITIGDIDVEFTQNGTKLILADSYREVKQHGYVNLKVSGHDFEYTVKVLNITKVITTAEELLNLQSYSPNVKSYTWTIWSEETTENGYDGYFVLGNNIDLGDTLVKVTNHTGTNPARIWDDASEAAGFNGTLDGCGYTISGGVYSQGGLFGYLWKNGVIKNVAFANAKIDEANSSCLIGISVWGTLDNVLIQISENNVAEGENGAVAKQNGSTFKTNNVIVYDDSALTVETAGKRSTFVNHPSTGWGTHTNTYVFTNYYVAQAKNEDGCPIDPIAANKTLVEAGVDVDAFGSIWDGSGIWNMVGNRASFAPTTIVEKDLTGEILAEFDLNGEQALELILDELADYQVTRVSVNGISVDFVHENEKIIFNSESYKNTKQHGVVELQIYAISDDCYYSCTVNVLNITKVITTAEELLNLQSYSPNVKSHTWTIWSDETTENGYDGYFVLGNNIDLSNTLVKVTNHTGSNPARIWYDAAEAAGFNGTFDGRGYTISGGVYSQGGLFGYLWKDSVVKNVAFVDVTINNTSLSSLLGISVWGTLDNVLIQISENNVSDGEIGAVAMNSGPTIITNNVIVYDDSALTSETAGKRSSFINHASDWVFGTYTNTYVFTNYSVAQPGNWETACPVDPILLGTTLAEAGVDISAFGSLWNMTGDRAKFANHFVTDVEDLTGEAKAEYNMSSDSTFELTLPELDGKEVTRVTMNNVDLDFTQNGTKLTFDSENYKAAKQHGLVELKITCNDVNYLVNVLNITKVITTAEELLNLQSYSPNVKSYTWSIWSDNTTENGYDGYFVLGNNIDLGDTLVKVTNHTGTNPARIWDDASEAAGFNGTLDGRGYTISGGVYSQGGLFGYLWKNGVIKNVAFINAKINDANSSCLIGISVWGTLDNVLIQISENNVAEGENGAVAKQNGSTFKTNNVIVYDDSVLTVETAGKRSTFVNHHSNGWGSYTNTYVFTNYYVAQEKNEAGCVVDPIATSKSLTDAGVDVSAFGEIWDMTGDRATFKTLSSDSNE